MMTSIRLFGAGSPLSRIRSATAACISSSLSCRRARKTHSTRRFWSAHSATTGGMFMALALSLGGWWYFHSRKVSSAAFAQEVAYG